MESCQSVRCATCSRISSFDLTASGEKLGRQTGTRLAEAMAEHGVEARGKGLQLKGITVQV
jgi:hypothetical protein